MRAYEELVERLATRRGERLGGLSAGAYDELLRAVRKKPEAFVDGADDQAFYQVVQAVERYERALVDEDLLDDDEYFDARMRRLQRLVADCHDALRVDVGCQDASLLAVLAADGEPAAELECLFELARHMPKPGDVSWDDVRSRAALRLHAALARTCLETGRYRMAAATAEAVIASMPGDELGCRHTCALAYARLEDEAAFDALDVRFGRRDGAWEHLGRSLLLYKLGRMPAARRALSGYARLVDGGAYALIRPVVVERYLPDRFEVDELCYDEATMAVWEAEPIIVDVPDFVTWAAEQPGFGAAAEAFALRNDFEW